MQVTACVGVRVAGRDQRTISAVDPDLELMLAPLLEVVALQVVDDGQVVDVAPARRDVAVLVPLVLLVELEDKLLYLTRRETKTLVADKLELENRVLTCLLVVHGCVTHGSGLADAAHRQIVLV